ncbi:MAG TPA: hypothetical protein VHZ77_04420 [Gaiellaceae bacterium]|nr:hypothetical protein [Gaiellaceae bacterium]
MIRRRRAGTGTLVVGLVAAAIAAGSAVAGTSTWMDVHARLKPVAGTKDAGRFDGVVSWKGGRVITPDSNVPVPSGSRWQLVWSLSLPKLDGPVTASVRIGRQRSSVHATRVLCTRCSAKANGTMTLTANQARRIAKEDAVVVVRTRSARLRGSVRVSVHTPVPGDS